MVLGAFGVGLFEARVVGGKLIISLCFGWLGLTFGHFYLVGNFVRKQDFESS